MNQSPPAGIPPPNPQDLDKKSHTQQIKGFFKKTKHKNDTDLESAGVQDQQTPANVNLNRTSTSVLRRPLPPAPHNGHDKEPGLEALRQESRDLAEKIRQGQTKSVQSTESSIDSQTQAPPDIPSSNSIPFSLSQYSAPISSTASPPYSPEALGLEPTYIPGGFPVDNFGMQPTQTIRAATMPQSDYTIELYEHYKKENQMLEEQRNGLKQALSRVELELSKKLDLIMHMESVARTNANSLLEKDTCIRDYQLNMGNLQGKHDVALIHAAELEKDNATLKVQVERANREIMQLKSDVKNFIEDKWFKDKWQDLHHKIEQLSNQYFTGRLKQPGSMLTRAKGGRVDKSDNELAKKVTRLTHSPGQYLGSENERSLLIQAFIWWILTNRIFDHMDSKGEGLYWTGQARNHFLGLKHEMKPRFRKDSQKMNTAEPNRLESESRKYHQWREATSIRLVATEPVSRRMKAIAYLVTNIIAEMTEALSPFIVLHKEALRPTTESDIRKQLFNILDEAIQLDADMHQQRAFIYCERWRSALDGSPDWGFRWCPEDQEMVLGPDQVKGGRTTFQDPCVELVVQPALLKRGNQYGEGYNKLEVLCKAKVVVGEDPLRPSGQKWS